jgi:hypothetical protein
MTSTGMSVLIVAIIVMMMVVTHVSADSPIFGGIVSINDVPLANVPNRMSDGFLYPSLLPFHEAGLPLILTCA